MKSFLKLARNRIQWRTVASVAAGVTLAVNVARQQYNIACEEDTINRPKGTQIISTQPVSSDFGIQTITRFSSISDLIIHHRTESECIVILPSCSQSTRELILKNLQRKKENKSFRVFVFEPVIDTSSLSHLSTKDQKREQERQAEIAHRLDNAEFFGINSYGDLKFFSLNTNQLNANDPSRSFQADFQRAMSFFYPLKTVRDSEFTSLVDSITNLPLEERLVVCYIPDEKVYDANLPRISSFDSFRQGRVKNIRELERRFREISYFYVEKNTKFVLIRSPEIAQSLAISEDDAGELYQLKRSSIATNKESNWTFAGKEYVQAKIQTSGLDTSTLDLKRKSDKIIARRLYETGSNYVQTINIDTDLRAFLVSSQEFGVKRVLVYFSAEALEQEYEEKVIQKLAAVKKNVADKDLAIIFTKNSALLTKFFGVIPEKNIDTVRLLDYQTTQTDDSRFSEWAISSIESNIDHTRTATTHVHENEVTDFEKNASKARRFKYEGKPTRNKLSGFVKQAISNKCTQPIYEENEGHILGVPKTGYLNAANFSNEVLYKDQLNNDAEEISLVYFYKPGCPNCTAMGKALEKFQEDLTYVRSDLQAYESQEKKYQRYDDTLLNRYRLDNHSRFKSVKIYRYNIYNESKEFPSPSAAPLVFIFTKNNRFKPQQADLLKDRVNINDAEKVSRYLFKKVDLLNI